MRRPRRPAAATWMRRPSGVGVRIALACLAVMAVAVAVIAIGVLAVGESVFSRLMVAQGSSAAEAAGMFDESVGRIFVAASALGVALSVILALILARRLTQPLKEIGAAASRLAAADYTARAPRRGPSELATLADSFNQMAGSLEEQERQRRELIANFAHELRTPLTNLHGYLEALRDGVMQPDPELFASLHEEVERLQRLSRSLDYLAEGETHGAAAVLEALDLYSAVGGAVELARPALERNSIRLEVRLPERLPAKADPDRVAQVMSNLLQNATRYTPQGGQVWVEALPLPGELLVSVTNSGGPIPTDDLPRIFERFYRVEKSRDRTSGGAGIGLALVRQLVESSGGRVGVESGAGRNRFWFSLPA